MWHERGILALALFGALAAAGCGSSSKSSDSGGKSTPDAQQFSTKEKVWALGNKISLAALGSAEGAPADAVSHLYDAAKVIAKDLGTDLPPLPKLTGEKTKDDAEALAYLLQDAGSPVGGFLKTKYGEEYSALYELAVKSQTLNILYLPNDSISTAIGESIQHNATKAGLPETLWKPLLAKISGGASFQEMQDELRKLESGVSAYLASHK
jgi:hypothetical protein